MTKQVIITALVDLESKRCGVSCEVSDEGFAIIDLILKGMKTENWTNIPLDVTGKRIKEKKA